VIVGRESGEWRVYDLKNGLVSLRMSNVASPTKALGR
jgi:hypothetical protein